MFTLLEEAKAFSCQLGDMIVQQSKDPELVNIILKPYGLAISYIPVAYYVYRGIKKDSLILGSNQLAAKSSSSRNYSLC